MIDYALIQFDKEERYMQKFEYPNFIEHKKEHKNYIYKVSMFNYNLIRNNPVDPVEIFASDYSNANIFNISGIVIA